MLESKGGLWVIQSLPVCAEEVDRVDDVEEME